MTAKNSLITGRPGIGKTTLIRQVAEALHPYHPAGFYTEEIWEGGERKGFELVSLAAERSLPAHVDIERRYRIGKYRVDTLALDRFLGRLSLLDQALRVVIIDEIGPMEILSYVFRRTIEKVLDAPASCIATAACRGDRFIDAIKGRSDVQIREMTAENRGQLFAGVRDDIVAQLGPP